MARAARDARLETRTQRLKLTPGLRYFLPMGEGLSLCYRRTTDGYGVWSARLTQADGRERLIKVAAADDFRDANDSDCLTFHQAQARIRALAEASRRDALGLLPSTITVADAVERYMGWYTKHRKAVAETLSVIQTHILPTFGRQRVADLSTREIRAWHQRLAESPARKRTSRLAPKPRFRDAPGSDNARRARQATANRVLTVFKALLNRAFTDELAHDDRAWRRVRPFPNADAPRIRFLTESEAVRLVNAADPNFRVLVRAALLTGARYSELAELKVEDVPATPHVFIKAGKGRARYVALNPAGHGFFQEQILGKGAQEFVFQKANGESWGKNHQVRALAKACEAARVSPSISFHVLRHTYASVLAQAGVSLQTISALLGHADTRITAKNYAHLCDTTLATAVTAHLPGFAQSSESNLRLIR